MPRRKRTTLQRAALFNLHGGICHLCGEKIDATREKWDLDHEIPYALMLDDSDENLKPAHDRCHRGENSKTSADVKMLAKVKRVAAKHQGARPKSNWPGAGKVKRKVGGGVEWLTPRRDEE